MTESKKESFILYTEHQELFEELTNEQAGKLIKGIFHYVKTGETPVFEGTNKMAFIPIRQMLDRNAAKYEEKCEKLRQNGKKGGRNPDRSENSDKTKQESTEKQEEEMAVKTSKQKASRQNQPSAKSEKKSKSASRNKKEDDCVDFTEIVKNKCPEFYKRYEEYKKSKGTNSS